MTYLAENLVGGGAQASLDAPQFWIYKTVDAITVVEVSGYFDEAFVRMRIGDLIYLYTDIGGTAIFSMYAVSTRTAGVIALTELTSTAV